MDGKNIHLFDQKADELLERLAEKEAHLLALSEEQCGGIDLDQMIGQRERLNNEFMLSLNVLSRQVLELCAEADHIVELFPRTSEHLEVRRGELIEQLKDVREGADRQTERLAQSQEFRELMIWARQMHATITGELLPKEVAGCEALSARHAEFRREISSKEAEKLKITQKGDQMLAQGHNALINEIRSRITTLEEVFTDLLRTWHRRQQIYEDNADLQRWLSSASELERWLTEREQLLAQDWTGLVQDGLEAVEHQIRQFDDFLATLDAQSPQFEALKRLTRLEQNWERLKGQEDRERIAAVNARLQQQQQNRRETQPIRTLEKKKMLQEKRQERERRKTQEISLMGNSAGGIGRQSATGHSIRSSTSAHSGAHMLGQIQQLEPVQSMSTTAFNNSSQTLPRARQRAAGGATSSASSSTSVVVVEGQQTIVPPVSSSRLSIEISQPSSTQQQQNSTPSAPFPVGMRVPPTGRTPGFTTRRTQSIRRSRQWDDLRTVDIHGYLDRKQELQAGGKRATFRSWKSYYSILCGQLLCFFKDEQHFMENMAASAPLALHGSNSALNPEYIKKRFVFKLNTADGAEFLFAAPDQLKALEWVDKINFRAKLDPADQLLAFRPSTSEPLGNPQSRRLPYSSTAADIMSNSRSTTLEPRPKPRELGGNVVNTFKLPNESQKMIKSATLDPRRIGDDKHNYYSSTNQKNEGIEQKIENQQFASQIKIGEEVEEEEKIIVEEEDLENSPNNNCRNNQNGSSHIFEDTISVRSGMGGTIKSKKITSGAFAFLRRSSAVIGGKKSACENSLDLN
uniref:PH domain-containing protein n=1 Tax=Meloidogyne hapla TaxID=6305 RepID=A0A1I8B4T5_MELHA